MSLPPDLLRLKQQLENDKHFSPEYRKRLLDLIDHTFARAKELELLRQENERHLSVLNELRRISKNAITRKEPSDETD